MDKKKRNATWVSAVNGWSILITGVVVLLIAGWLVDWLSIAIAAAVTISGTMEVVGGKKLKGNERVAARKWLVASQVWLLLVIAGYSVWRLVMLDPKNPLAGMSNDFRQLLEGLFKALAQGGQALNDMIVIFFYTVYISVIIATLLYQGGLALYYYRRTGETT